MTPNTLIVGVRYVSVKLLTLLQVEKALSKHEVKNLKLSELNPVNIVHFYGEKKPIPPCLNVTSGMEFELLKKQENSVRQAFQEDSTWLRSVRLSIKGNDSDYNEIEWAGYMKEMHS